MSDILGSTANRRIGELISANHIQLSLLGGRAVAFGASAQGRYEKAITPTEVFGSDTIYYTSGPSQGEANVGAVVGDDGWFAGAQGGNPCRLQQIRVHGNTPCGGGGGGFTILDALLQGVGFQWAAGATPVTDSARFLFTGLRR